LGGKSNFQAAFLVQRRIQAILRFVCVCAHGQTLPLICGEENAATENKRNVLPERVVLINVWAFNGKTAQIIVKCTRQERFFQISCSLRAAFASEAGPKPQRLAVIRSLNCAFKFVIRIL
jgi:hypothetical protein